MNELLQKLQAGEDVPDHEFDRIYPNAIRKLAPIHWTPVSIAKKAALLLAIQPDARILDVGSGVGKFCLVGAATTQASFAGVERRPHLVQTAQNLATQLHWPRVEFILGDAFELDWNDFTGIYLFNPFAEHLFKEIRMDHQVDPGLDAHQRATRIAQNKLDRLLPGTRVATLNGFGGAMSDLFTLEHQEACGNGELEIWVKDA